jgi:UDP-glucuronate 4-epimerase
MKVLLTGCAGFIGMHTALKLLARGDEVIGVDNLNDYYDVGLKESRLALLNAQSKFSFHQLNIEDFESLKKVCQQEAPDCIIHLAAQAGVRYSIENPHAYGESNLKGFINILELSRFLKVQHLVYASSSSVYGGNTNEQCIETQNVDHPVSLYAATKKANELMAHTYSHLYGIPTTGLRFFTVYGPWGRPDMALFKFTHAMLKQQAIDVYNHGEMVRDFTYIDDVVDGVVAVLDQPASPSQDYAADNSNPSISNAPYRVFNIGNSHPTTLMDYIGALEEALGINAKKNYMPMQAGDVLRTSANIDLMKDWVGFSPKTSVKEGVKKFVDWYQSYY